MTQVDNVVIVRFTEPSKAYQALSVIKDCAADGRIGLESAAVVQRTADGQLHLPESTDNVGLAGTAGGSVIGMLLGVIGGPLGVLLGMGTGALVGGLADMDRAETTDDAVADARPGDPAGLDRGDRERGRACRRGPRRRDAGARRRGHAAPRRRRAR